MNIAFDIDDTITRIPKFFAWLSEALRASGHRVVIITYRMDRESAMRDLDLMGVVYDRLVTCTLDAVFQHGTEAWKAAMCREEAIDVFFEDDLEQARHVSGETVVFSPMPLEALRME